jgi:hypothetical protein
LVCEAPVAPAPEDSAESSSGADSGSSGSSWPFFIVLSVALLWGAAATVLLINKAYEIRGIEAARDATLKDHAALEQRRGIELAAAIQQREDFTTQLQAARTQADEFRQQAKRADQKAADLTDELTTAQENLKKLKVQLADAEQKLGTALHPIKPVEHAPPARDDDDRMPVVDVGERVTLRSKGNHVFIATDAAWDDFSNAVAANDELGLAGLIARGEVRVIKSGTAAKIIDTAFFTVKVRILEGDHVGRAGWIYREFVRPSR